MEGKTGTVKWFCKSKGYGWIIPDSEGPEIYVWFKNTLDIIKDSDRVIYDEFKGEKSMMAINVKRYLKK